ncbi:NAD(P)/FAD-dependent oxidoreductase [Cytophagaceae bacterium DM2B3-1]|uniref:NAD(P)/FAD-dependent oxidoreductase n=1 Tax=Xanthocytophaga flava TaxID=3048013 RepID=A0ABT7CED9_9BACT|nr:NAD(P)/FAD-dependent oxidoreductase [Xanthocytophaga flavus]MDJ1468896.1 NAD(P)/FAD-dependent oxidoreductase [Xanthocytophaga flavus]MDJ1492070.1 NAD(P)/FAD-dependent oxidoreductase [Xanthocytophaga flavus]
MKQTHVCIIGAGPGGSTAALQLAKAGISCTLLDKAVFPRDKICGDALSGKVVSELRRIQEDFLPAIHTHTESLPSQGIHFIAPNEKWLSISFKSSESFFTSSTTNSVEYSGFSPGYLMRRMDFDNFLIEQVKKNPLIDFQEGVEVTDYQKTEAGWVITASNQQSIETKLLIVANGAQSNFTRHIAGITTEPKHFCAGLRAYYEGVEGLDLNGFIELHFLKPFLPGYFWIFPLANGYANVGVGMLSDTISRQKINLKKSMQELIQTHPALQKRFANAKLQGEIKGYGLPLGSKRRKLSGDGYMLVGDAAHLIDPFTGEGISNAMISGRWAADQAVKSIQNQVYSGDFLAGYDQAVYRRLGNELRISTRMQRLLAYPSLFNMVVNRANRNPALKQLLSSMFNDIDLRSSLRSPTFYARLLFQ